MVSFGSAPSRLTDLGNWADLRCRLVGLSKISPRNETKNKVEIRLSSSGTLSEYSTVAVLIWLRPI